MYTEYIKIENGQVKNHPVALDNLQQIYPDFLNNYQSLGYLPCEFFPAPGYPSPYCVITPVYTISGNVVQISYNLRPMTAEEKIERIAVRMNDPKPYESWIFDEATCDYISPVPHPQDGQQYNWDEETTSWVLVNE